MGAAPKSAMVGKSGLWVSSGKQERPVVPKSAKPTPNLHDWSVVLPGGPHRSDAPGLNAPPCLGIGTIGLFNQGQPAGVGSGFLCQPDVFLTAKHVLTDVSYDSGNVWLAYDAVHNPASPKLTIAAYAMHATLDLVVLVLASHHPGAFALGAGVGNGSHVELGGYAYPYPNTSARLSVGTGPITTLVGNKVTYLIDTDEADSGAPVFLAGTPTAVGVHLRGQQPGDHGNEGLLLTPATVNDINGLVAKARSHIGG